MLVFAQHTGRRERKHSDMLICCVNICSEKSDIFEEKKNTKKFIPIRSHCQTRLTYKSSFLVLDYKVPAEPDGEPVDDLDNRDKADSKAETAEPSKAGDEVKPGHLGGALKLCKERWQIID